jgi:hypothetical protein
LPRNSEKAFYEDILKKKKSFSHSSVLDYFKPSSGTHASLLVLLDIG